MARTREDFLADCDEESRDTSITLFAQLEDLARDLGDLDPANEKALHDPLSSEPLRLRLTFAQDVSWALKLKHPKLTNEGSLLWGFPSRNHDLPAVADALSVPVSDLRGAGIRESDIQQYGVDLRDALFGEEGPQNWRTEAGDLAKIFRWPVHQSALLSAFRRLVEAINAY